MAPHPRTRSFLEGSEDLNESPGLDLVYRLRAAASMLQISETTLKSYEKEFPFEIPRRSGSGQVPVREYTPELLFRIAAWRRERGLASPIPSRPLTVAVHNQKGGVGKTLLAVELATKWQLMGLRVLVIDVDAQFNTTMQFGLDPTEDEGPKATPYSILNLLGLGHDVIKPLPEILRKPYGEHGPHLIPSNFDLSNLEYALGAATSREYKFSKLLRRGRTNPKPDLDFTPYDIVLFDTPPSTMTSVVNALVASDIWLIPVTLDRFSIKGLSTLMQILDMVRQDLEWQARVFLVPNRFSPRRSRIVEYLEILQQYYPDSLTETVLPESEAIPSGMGRYPAPVSLSSPLEDVVRGSFAQLATELLEKALKEGKTDG